MMYTSVIIASALAALATAQSTATASTTVSQAMPAVATQAFDISQVNGTLKAQWCTAQYNTCRDMCLGHWEINDCSNESLAFQCICYNGTEPDSTSFIQTVPYFECQATYGQCIDAHPNDEQAQTTCTANEQCPTRNATAERFPNGVSSSSETSSSASSTSGTQTSSASATAASHSSAGNAAVPVSPASTGAFAALLFALCKLVL